MSEGTYPYMDTLQAKDELESYRRANRDLSHEVNNLRSRLSKAEEDLKRANTIVDALCRALQESMDREGRFDGE
jgi:predicted  nucleic acid-binding Zn-ribbon protein